MDELFGKPGEYESGPIKLRFTRSSQAKNSFERGSLDDGLTEDILSQNSETHLGAPPEEDRAPAGRMNVEYIPVFYGAFSEDTAVAEIRPGIGDEIAIGEFVLQREVKVFDFTVFSRAPRERWDEVYSHTRYDFIRQMEDQIGRRVLPHERQRQYIPTQVTSQNI